jgi:hypothetical protein
LSLPDVLSERIGHNPTSLCKVQAVYFPAGNIFCSPTGSFPAGILLCSPFGVSLPSDARVIPSCHSEEDQCSRCSENVYRLPRLKVSWDKQDKSTKKRLGISYRRTGLELPVLHWARQETLRYLPNTHDSKESISHRKRLSYGVQHSVGLGFG